MSHSWSFPPCRARRAHVALLSALTLAAAACGGSDGTGILAPPTVASVAVTPATASIRVGATTTLSATPKDASGNTLGGHTIAWSSDNTAVATVSGSGVVTGKSAGTATITATTDGVSGTAAVTVTAVPVASVRLSATSATLLVGVADTTLGLATLSATEYDSAGVALAGRTVTWSSSVPAVATVSPSGVVAAVDTGTTTITATSEGKTATATITVVEPAVAAVIVAPDTSSIRVGASETLALTLKDAQGRVLAHRFVIAFNNSTAIMTVNGLQITGKAAGTGTVSYSSEGVSTVATVNVTP